MRVQSVHSYRICLKWKIRVQFISVPFCPSNRQGTSRSTFLSQVRLSTKSAFPSPKNFGQPIESAELSKSVDKLHPSNILFDVIYRSIGQNFESFSLSELLEVDFNDKTEVVWPRAFQTLSKSPNGLLLCFVPRYFWQLWRHYADIKAIFVIYESLISS